MKKTVLTYGLISGVIGAVLLLAHVPFMDGGSTALFLGYAGIVLSALLIFFGVRSYRENVGNGKISFGRGFAVGILIALISAACYVAAWEYQGDGKAPVLHKEPLSFENVKLSTRSYK